MVVYYLSRMVLLSIQGVQMCLNSGVIDTQEFGRTSHGVNIEVLALGPLFVHEAENGIVRPGVLEDYAGYLKQCSAQMRRSALGNSAGFGIEGARLIGRRIHTSKSNQSSLMSEAPNIANLGHKLGACDFACTIHGHYHVKLRQQRSQTEHLTPQDV